MPVPVPLWTLSGLRKISSTLSLPAIGRHMGLFIDACWLTGHVQLLFLYGGRCKVASLPKFTVDMFVATKTLNGAQVPCSVQCPAATVLKDINKKRMTIASTCSAMFKKSHTAALSRVEKTLLKVVELLRAAALQVLDHRAGLAGDLLLKVVEKTVHGNNKKPKEQLINEALSLIVCVPPVEMDIMQEVYTKAELDKYHLHVETIAKATEKMRNAGPWLTAFAYGDAPELSSTYEEEFFAGLETITKEISDTGPFQNFRGHGDYVIGLLAAFVSALWASHFL